MDDDELVSGMVSPNSAIWCPIGAVHTTGTLDESGEWVWRRYLVTGTDGGWITSIPDPENPA